MEHQDYTVLLSPSGHAAAIIHRKHSGQDRITVLFSSTRVSVPRCGTVQCALWRTDVTLVICDSQGALWSIDVTQDTSSDSLGNRWVPLTKLPNAIALFALKSGTSLVGAKFCSWDGAQLAVFEGAQEHDYKVISNRTFSSVSALKLSHSGKVVALVSPQEGLFVVRVANGKVIPISLAGKQMDHSACVGIEFLGTKHLVVLTQNTLCLIQLSDYTILRATPLEQGVAVKLVVDENVACVVQQRSTECQVASFYDLLSGKALTTYSFPSTPTAVSLCDHTLTTVWSQSATLYRVHFAHDWCVKGSVNYLSNQTGLAELLSRYTMCERKGKVGTRPTNVLDILEEEEEEGVQKKTPCGIESDKDMKSLFATCAWTPLEMCESVRHLTWMQCLRLAELCCEAVQANPQRYWPKAVEWCSFILRTHPNTCLKNVHQLQKILTPITEETKRRCHTDIESYCSRLVGMCDLLGDGSSAASIHSIVDPAASSKVSELLQHDSLNSFLEDPYIVSLASESI